MRLPRLLLTALLAAPMAVALVQSTAPAAEPTAAAAAPASDQVTRVGEATALDAAVAYSSATDSPQQVVRHPGATYIKVHFSSFKLKAGDYVTVSDPAGREVHTYSGDPTRGLAAAGDTDYTRHDATGFAAMSIDGDTAVVTLHSGGYVDASALSRNGYGVRIDRFWRGYDERERAAANIGIESVCGTDGRRDSVCYKDSHPTEYVKSAAVGKLLIGGGGSCTAWRVGATNRILTNNHCISTASGVTGSEVHFKYECQTCGGNNPGVGVKVSGAQFFKTSANLDYTLFSVNSFDTITQFGTLYLETRAPVLNERIYIPGHGDGSPQRLSMYLDPNNGGGTCKIDSVNSDATNTGYNCDTSGGSSGSPVIAASSHKVIALHHLGGCLNEGTRMALIYPEIATLIDNGGGTTPPGDSFANETDFAIADNSTVNSPIAVTGQSTASTVKVDVNITHTYIGDLVVSLVAPDGSVYVLHNRSGGSTDNLVTSYQVNVTGEAPNGTWQLRVADQANADVGTLNRWAITF